MFNFFGGGGGGEESHGGTTSRQKRFRTSHHHSHNNTPAAASNLSVPLNNNGGGGCGGCTFHKDDTNNYNSDASSIDDEFEEASIKLNQLSFQERTLVESELHGIDEEDYIKDETPDMIANSLAKLDDAIMRLLNNTTSTTSGSGMGLSSSTEKATSTTSMFAAYIKAMEISQEYVEKIKIQCLRADSFRCKDAALRVIHYFHRKSYLFGGSNNENNDGNNYLLVQDIRLKDLTKEENTALKQGLFLLLPHRDRAGRGILVVQGSVNQEYTTKQVMRVFWYVMTVACQDINCSKRGVVGIYHGFGQTKHTPGRPKEWWLNWRSFSMRIVALHYCGGDGPEMKVLTPPVQALFAFADRFTVCRVRMHYGPLVECLYRLLTFGLPVNEAMPVTPDGQIQLKFHHEMIETWKMREELADLSTLFTSSSNGGGGGGGGDGLIDTIEEDDNDFGFEERKNSSSVLATTATTATSPSTFTASATSFSTKEGSMSAESDNNNNNSNFIDVNVGGSSSSNPTSTTMSSSSSSSSDSSQYVIPGSLDILMGRGRHPKSRPGAMRLHELIIEHKSEYNNATKTEKIVLSQQILAKLKGQGCRFLNYNKDRGYEICDDNVARKKIAHGFRNQRLKDCNNGSYPSKQQKGGSSNNNNNNKRRSIDDD